MIKPQLLILITATLFVLSKTVTVSADSKLTASDGGRSDRFSGTVSISGDTAVIGAFEDADDGRESGSAYIADLLSGTSDVDGDEVLDDDDNCPRTYNPKQEDNDGDGCGDACDGRPDDPNWLTISGSITYEGIPLCAMVLANGQYMFTCTHDVGVWDLTVPLDEYGQITLHGFCSELAPFEAVLWPTQALCYDIFLVTAPGYSPEMMVTIQTEQGINNPDWVKISGTVTYDETPLCAMVLANGQYMFTCSDPVGSYDMEVPLGENSEILLYVFCSGLAPYKEVIKVQGNKDSIITVSPSDDWTKIESAQAGDIVEILPGTYQFRVYLTNNGTTDDPIVIRAQDPDDPPVWDFNGRDCDDWPGSYSGGDRGRGGWQITGSYYEISEIIIRNAYLKTGNSISDSSGMRQKGSQNIVIRDCLFENNDNGVSGHGEDILYEYCIIRYNGNPDGDTTHNVYTHGGTQTFRFCHIHDPDEGQNLHIRARKADFEYCLIENAGTYTGDLMVSTNDYVEGQVLQETLNLIGCVIVESEEQGNDTKAFTLYNSPRRDKVRMRINMYYNTFIGNGNDGAVVRFTNSGLLAHEAYLYNNIFYNCHSPFRFDTKDAVTAEARNNWWPSNFDYSEFDAYMSNSYYGTDPEFSNPRQGDYTLKQTSSCVGFADQTVGDIPIYQMDFGGTILNYLLRTTANDLGAFESDFHGF